MRADRWDSAQYLRFESERTRPARDLAERIDLASPGRIVDLGCGPGTSTSVLRQRWPRAAATGVDSSPEMLEVARRSDPSTRWIEADLRSWSPGHPQDLVFSNAVLHWIPDHPRAVPRLWGWVAPGGALAFQVPVRGTPPAGWVRALRAVRERPPWDSLPTPPEAESPVLPPEQYYDLLAPEATRVDLWDTEYHHVMQGPDDVVEWVKGTALRPWLQALPTDEARAGFLRAYREEVARNYPQRPDGRVLFPFLRRFVIAYR